MTSPLKRGEGQGRGEGGRGRGEGKVGGGMHIVVSMNPLYYVENIFVRQHYHYSITSNRFVSGSANPSNTNLISVHSSCDLNSCRYLKWSKQHVNFTLYYAIANLKTNNIAQYTNLLNNEWAVCRTPFIMWKSPLLNLVTMSYKLREWKKVKLASLNRRSKTIPTFLQSYNTYR